MFKEKFIKYVILNGHKCLVPNSNLKLRPDFLWKNISFTKRFPNLLQRNMDGKRDLKYHCCCKFHLAILLVKRLRFWNETGICYFQWKNSWISYQDLSTKSCYLLNFLVRLWKVFAKIRIKKSGFVSGAEDYLHQVCDNSCISSNTNQKRFYGTNVVYETLSSGNMENYQIKNHGNFPSVFESHLVESDSECY